MSSSSAPPATIRLDGGLVDIEGVDIRPVDAAACGAFGCVADRRLVRVQLAEKQYPRVLCPEHAAGLIQSEADW